MLLRQVSFHGHLESYAGLQSFTEHRQLQIREDPVNNFFLKRIPVSGDFFLLSES